mmetsp:Transcript_116030/g.374810  ORF Transcript_116030/g.374810 Transcript_116030/m.374810 type:complete len:265 (+) Transcript_116030:582-1376(+)
MVLVLVECGEAIQCLQVVEAHRPVGRAHQEEVSARVDAETAHYVHVLEYGEGLLVAWRPGEVKDLHCLVCRAREERGVHGVEGQASDAEHVVVQGPHYGFHELLLSDAHACEGPVGAHSAGPHAGAIEDLDATVKEARGAEAAVCGESRSAARTGLLVLRSVQQADLRGPSSCDALCGRLQRWHAARPWYVHHGASCSCAAGCGASCTEVQNMLLGPQRWHRRALQGRPLTHWFIPEGPLQALPIGLEECVLRHGGVWLHVQAL